MQLLIKAPGRIFDLYRERSAQHRKAQHAFISAHPAAIPDARERITWLSRLAIAEPQIEVAAYVERTIAQLAVMDPIDDAKGGKGKDRGSRASACGGQIRQRSDLGPTHLKRADFTAQLANDGRTEAQVIEEAAPVFNPDSGVGQDVAF